MRYFTLVLSITGALLFSTASALASTPVPTPHSAPHRHPDAESSKVSPASATLTAELEKPVTRPESSDLPAPPLGQDTGGLDDVGDVGGDFEE